MYRVGVSRCGGEGRRFLACHAFIRSGYQGWRPSLWTRWGPGLSFNPDWGRNPTDARPVPCSALESGTLQSTPHARRCLDPSGASRKVQSPFERLCGPIGGFTQGVGPRHMLQLVRRRPRRPARALQHLGADKPGRSRRGGLYLIVVNLCIAFLLPQTSPGSSPNTPGGTHVNPTLSDRFGKRSRPCWQQRPLSSHAWRLIFC